MTDDSCTADDAWLTSMLPFVREQLPPPPARIVEIGCGSLGGFVPALVADGHAAVGVDPAAPEGTTFHRMPFELYAAQQSGEAPADVVVASLSLHHVDDPAAVLDQVAGRLAAGGLIVVLEWASERFDEATAQWCFARLSAPLSAPLTAVPSDSAHDGEHDGHSWLHHMATQWRETGQPWDTHFRAWLQSEGLHPGDTIIGALQQRFDTVLLREGPYFFSELEVSRDEELVAIRAGEIQPGSLQFVGRRR